MPRRYWRSILVVSAFVAGALGNWDNTSTGIDLDKLPRFPLVKIRSGPMKDGSRATFDGITAIAPIHEREVRLSGLGKSGKRWEVHMCCLDEVWRGDLDGNGTQDYVLFNGGAFGNGRTAPSSSLSILLMDHRGLPVPFFTTVFKGENGDGIKHVVDLARDGHAELLDSIYDEHQSDPRVDPFCSGHWTTLLYQFKNVGVEEFRGTMGGLKFPFVHNWTYRGGICPELEKPFMPAQPPPLLAQEASRRAAVTTKIRKVDETGWLAIEPAAGCETVDVGTIVYDHGQVREIGFPNPSSSYYTGLGDAMRRDGVRVELRDVERLGHGDCSASSMWAGQ